MLTAVILLIGICILDPNSDSCGDEENVILFVLWRLVLSLFLALITLKRSSQITLIIGSILYGACFSFIYGSFGAQSGIALLYMGIYSLPVMVPAFLGVVAAPSARVVLIVLGSQTGCLY